MPASSLAIAVGAWLILVLWNALYRRYWRRGRTAATTILRRVSWCLMLAVLVIMTRAEVQLFTEQITASSIVYGVLLGIVEIMLLLQWIVLPVVKFIRHGSRPQSGTASE